MTAHQVATAAAAIVVVALAIYGAGRAWGRLTGDLAEIKGAVGKQGAKLDALHRRLDDYRKSTNEEITRLKVTDAEISGRVDLVERLQGLPPPWKRTQPIHVQPEPPAEPAQTFTDGWTPGGAR